MSRTRQPQSVALTLRAEGFLAGWRPEDGSLFLPALSDSKLGDEVAARVGILGKPFRATLFGSVSMIRRVGRPSLLPGIVLSLDRSSLPAVRFLASAAKGDKVLFRERAPRYEKEAPLLISWGAAAREATTLNVSEGGCALSWAGPAPEVRDVIVLKLGDGFFGAHQVRAAVCWKGHDEGAPRSVFGVRVLTVHREKSGRWKHVGDRWKKLAAEAARAGAVMI